MDQSTKGQIGAFTRWSQEDPVVGTAAARAAGPGSVEGWLSRVDPDGKLPEAERYRRAVCAHKAHMIRLSQRSAEVRAARKRGEQM